MPKDSVPREEQEKGLVLYQHAKEVVVNSQSTYDSAATFLTEIKTREKRVETLFEPMCSSTYSAWQTALNQKKQYLVPYQNAEAEIKGKMGQYQLEQRRLQEEAERRAMEEAEAQAEKERQALLKKAAKLESKGTISGANKAEELRAQADMVFVPAVAENHQVGKVDGIAATDTLEVEIVNLKKFLEWLSIISPLDPSNIVTVKTGPLKQYLKMVGMTEIPGCRVTKSVRISAKGR